MAVYDAFISYSHAKDKPVAAALQSVVQTLGKPWYRRRALRVFRDDTSLSATPSLWPAIEQALAQSRYLILLASPEAAASHWVGKEVAYWLEHKGAATLLIALTDGELAWDGAAGGFGPHERLPLPPALAGGFANEPKWIDLRPYRDAPDRQDNTFKEQGADFAAAIHGMPKEDLLSQELRQQRRALRLAWSAAALLFVLAGVAGWKWKDALDAERVAIEQKQVAETQRDRAETNFGIAKGGADHLVLRIARDLRDAQGMSVASLRRILEAAQVMADQLAKAAPDDVDLQRSRVAMLNEFATTFLSAGDLTRAGTAAEEALTIARRFAAADAGNIAGNFSWQRGASASLDRIGDIRLAMGDRAGALAAYEESLAIVRKVASADAANQGWQRDVAVSVNKIGDMRFAAGDRLGALAAYEEGLGVMRAVAAADPDNNRWQRDITVSLIKAGDARLAAGDRPGALAAYEESLAIHRRVVAADGGNLAWQRDVSVSLERLGDVRRASGERTAALAAYDESLEIRRRLAAADPGNAGWQGDLSRGLDRIGSMRLAAGDRAGALAAYEERLAIVRKFASAHPENSEWQSGLSVSLERVGDARTAAGDRPGALAVYEESLGIRRKLTAIDEGNALWLRDLGVSINKVGDALRASGKRAEALVVFEEGLAIKRKLVARDEANAQWQRDLSVSLNRIAEIRHAAGDRLAAVAGYEESLAIRHKLVAADPGNADWQADLVGGLVQLSTAAEPARARAALREALEAAERLAHDGKLTPAQQGWPQDIRNRLARLPPEQAEVR